MRTRTRSTSARRAGAAPLTCGGLLLAALLIGACDGGGPDGSDATEQQASAALNDDGAPGAPEPAGPEDAPDEVYFDLTRHDWYRQGQPLMHGGRSYEVAGEPISLAPDSLDMVGRYQQVEYYARKGDSEPFYTLYVPVYYRYWQRFSAPPGR